MDFWNTLDRSRFGNTTNNRFFPDPFQENLRKPSKKNGVDDISCHSINFQGILSEHYHFAKPSSIHLSDVAMLFIALHYVIWLFIYHRKWSWMHWYHWDNDGFNIWYFDISSIFKLCLPLSKRHICPINSWIWCFYVGMKYSLVILLKSFFIFGTRYHHNMRI